MARSSSSTAARSPKPLTTIAIAGIRGSYAEEAASRIAPAAELIECPTFAAVFDALADGSAKHAVLPIRNKIVGEIIPVAELLTAHEYVVRQTLRLAIEHVLAGAPSSTLSSITTVLSHPEALRQCSRFVTANRLDAREVSDTATGVEKVIESGDVSLAAICSPRAATIYGADLLCTEIADQPGNWTDFYLIG